MTSTDELLQPIHHQFDSSWLSRALYYPHTGEMLVWAFERGSSREQRFRPFYRVPRSVFDRWRNETSSGAFFNRHIRGNYFR